MLLGNKGDGGRPPIQKDFSQNPTLLNWLILEAWTCWKKKKRKKIVLSKQ